MAENNELIRVMPDYNPDVILLDWASLAPGCPAECVDNGGFDDVGAGHFAELILDAVQE